MIQIIQVDIENVFEALHTVRGVCLSITVRYVENEQYSNLLSVTIAFCHGQSQGFLPMAC